MAFIASIFSSRFAASHNSHIIQAVVCFNGLVPVEYVGRHVCACAVRYRSLGGCMSFTLIVAKQWRRKGGGGGGGGG